MVIHTTDVLCGTKAEKGPPEASRLLEHSQLFHGGPPLRFPEGGGTWHTPLTPAISEHQAGRGELISKRFPRAPRRWWWPVGYRRERTKEPEVVKE